MAGGTTRCPWHRQSYRAGRRCSRRRRDEGYPGPGALRRKSTPRPIGVSFWSNGARIGPAGEQEIPLAAALRWRAQRGEARFPARGLGESRRRKTRPSHVGPGTDRCTRGQLRPKRVANQTACCRPGDACVARWGVLLFGGAEQRKTAKEQVRRPGLAACRRQYAAKPVGTSIRPRRESKASPPGSRSVRSRRPKLEASSSFRRHG